MTRPLDIDRVLEEWIAEGPTALPDRVVDGIAQGIERTHQRGLLWPSGGSRMSRTVYALVGLAAVLVVLVSTGWYLGWFGGATGIGGQAASTPVVTSAPTPTPTPPPTPTSSQSVAVPSAADLTVPTTDFTAVAPGHYADNEGAYAFTFDVPAGWLSASEGALIFTASDFQRGAPDFAAGSTDFAAVAIPKWWDAASVSKVYTDPCHSNSTSLDTGTTAADLADALHEIAPMNPTVPDDISVGEFSGKHIILTVPEVDFSTCDLGQYKWLYGRFGQGPGQVDEYWILDLSGSRQIISTTYMPGTSQAIRNQQLQIIDSFQASGGS